MKGLKEERLASLHICIVSSLCVLMLYDFPNLISKQSVYHTNHNGKIFCNKYTNARCLFKSRFLVYPTQIAYVFILKCTHLLWRCKLLFLLKLLPHKSHWYGLLFKCMVTIWRFKTLFSLKHLPHKSHWYGLLLKGKDTWWMFEASIWLKLSSIDSK